MTLAIADRRVYQHGLTIPLGQFNAITMDGWVDFDRNLALKASVPLLPTMLRDRPDLPVLNNVFGGLRITVPISGTLAKPEVDRDAFNLANQDLGKTLLERTAGRRRRRFVPAPLPAPRPQRPTPTHARRTPGASASSDAQEQQMQP